jgi:hypothetical protein
MSVTRPTLGHGATLRALLLIGGILLLSGAPMARRFPSVFEDPLPLIAGLAGGLALVLAAIPRCTPRLLAVGGLLAAVPGTWLLFRLHVFSTAPQVDWLRPMSIDRAAWLPMGAVLVGLAAVRGVRARRSTVRLVTGLALLLSIGMAGAYQLGFQNFNQERIEAPTGLLYRSPVVQHGALGECFWSRQVIHGRPIALFGAILESERNVADLAHGIHLQKAEQHRATSGDPDQGRFGDRVRAALWALQKAATAVMLALQAALPLALSPLALLLVMGVKPPRWVERVALGWLLLPSLGVALCNLLFHGVMAIAALPDAARGRWGSIALALGLALLCLLVERAGRALTRAPDARKP